MAELRAPLRILISSSPKTGNTWLLHLLAALYDLLRMGVTSPFDEDQANSLGERWVAFHHMQPHRALLDWIESHNVVLLTTVRHPGDVLISLYHHLHAFERTTENPQVLRDMLHIPFERNLIEPPGRGTFADELSISIEWLRAGARRVRYEDLWRDPAAVLADLATALGPVPADRIDRAIEKCDLHLMRGLAGKHGDFFRSGQVGDWRQRLSPDILADLEGEPYRTQFAELGYTLDPSDPVISAPAKPRRRLNPFRDSPRFENGAAAAPIIADCYLSHDSEVTRQWGAASRTGPGSFFEWLNGPCRVEGEGIYQGLLVSNLAHYAYSKRSDLQKTFPHLDQPDRFGYTRWFVSHGESEFHLDPAFLEPMRADLPAWVNARSSCEGTGDGWPRLTNLARHLYASHSELSAAFPDLTGPDSLRFAEWFVLHGEAELAVDPAQTDAMRTELLEWGNSRSPEDRADDPWCPPLTRFAMYVYRMRDDAQRSYPDVFGADRLGYLRWLIEIAPELRLFPGFIDPIRRDIESRAGENPLKDGRAAPMMVDLYMACPLDVRRRWTEDSYFRWLNEPAKLEGTATYSGIHLSNLAYYIYKNRRDLAGAFPDLSGPGRANYAEWFVRHGEPEFGLGEAFLEPVRSSLIAWGGARNPMDQVRVPWWPKLTNFAMHLYASRQDVQSAYPRVLDADRWNFLQWTVDNAAGLNLYPALAAPIRNELQRLRLVRSIGRLLFGVRRRE